jgi:acetyl esterase/lipase
MRTYVTPLLIVIVCALPSSGLSAPPKPTRADLSYGPHPHQLLDLYMPDGDGPFPVMIWFGGLWKPSKGAPVHKFLPAGCAAVAVETRVMQDAIDNNISPPISVCLLDALRAVQFVRLHAVEWKLDPDRIGVAGGSQGALPALYVGCAGEKADTSSADPVERVSTRVTCVGAFRSQPSIDPQRMRRWVPGVEWGAPALGCSFAESLERRDELLPLINEWSPDALVHEGAPPIYFENEWGLAKPDDVEERNYLVHSPRWALGFQEIAQKRGAACYVKYLDHPTDGYTDIWDFLLIELGTKKPGG